MTLYAVEHGPGRAEAPTIVFLHGGGVGGWMWQPQVEALSGNYHCLVPDLPEHGRSREVGPFTILGAARQVADLIHTRAHGGRAHVVGLSLGGQVGVALLGLAPSLVGRAVLSGVLARPLPLSELMLFSVWLYGPLKNSDALIRANMRSLGVPERYYRHFAADTRQTSTAALGRILRAAYNFRLPPGLTRLDTPTLVVVGEKEPKLMCRSARLLVDGLRGATGRIARGVGHNWPLTAPGLFNATVRAWLADQELPDQLRLLRSK